MNSRNARRLWIRDQGIVDVVRVLLLLQAGFAALLTLEVVVMGLLTGSIGPLGPTLVLTGGTAVATLVLIAGLGRSWRMARRLIVAGEVLLLLGAVLDLVLALVLARAFLDLVPTLTRLVLPVAVIVLLRRATIIVPPRPDRYDLPLSLPGPPSPVPDAVRR